MAVAIRWTCERCHGYLGDRHPEAKGAVVVQCQKCGWRNPLDKACANR